MCIKQRARQAVRRAVKNGALHKPRFCEQCGSQDKKASDGRSTIHGHHYKGYEHPLDVQWLCVKCHFTHDLRPSEEDNGRSKLTIDQVQEIRSLYNPTANRWNPEGSAKWLARPYGLCDRTIRRIVRNELWIDAALTE